MAVVEVLLISLVVNEHDYIFVRSTPSGGFDVQVCARMADPRLFIHKA